MGEVKTPRERVVRINILATAFNTEELQKRGQFIVDLACGHVALSRSLTSSVCARCTEMLRRSLANGTEDWDAFRHGSKPDLMAWTDDPVRLLNEPDDGGGNSTRDPDPTIAKAIDHADNG